VATDDRRRRDENAAGTTSAQAAVDIRAVDPGGGARAEAADVDAEAARRMRRRSNAGELRAVEAVMSALPEVFAPDLTARQRHILDYIRETVETRGYPPTVREIGEAVGLVSPSSVAYQMGVLQRKGYLRKDPNRPRAVDVRPPSELA
jgi:repressor LexA